MILNVVMVSSKAITIILLVLPIVAFGWHNFTKGSTFNLADDVRFNLAHVNRTPFIFKAHHKAKGDAVFVWFGQVILPKVLKYDVLSYREGFALSIVCDYVSVVHHVILQGNIKRAICQALVCIKFFFGEMLCQFVEISFSGSHVVGVLQCPKQLASCVTVIASLSSSKVLFACGGGEEAFLNLHT